VKNGGTYTLTLGTNDVGHTFKKAANGNVLTNTATANAEDLYTFSNTMDGTNVSARVENNFGRQ
jgi:hypothetical protein